jgi:hypothetical protein
MFVLELKGPRPLVSFKMQPQVWQFFWSTGRQNQENEEETRFYSYLELKLMCSLNEFLTGNLLAPTINRIHQWAAGWISNDRAQQQKIQVHAIFRRPPRWWSRSSKFLFRRAKFSSMQRIFQDLIVLQFFSGFPRHLAILLPENTFYYTMTICIITLRSCGGKDVQNWIIIFTELLCSKLNKGYFKSF